MKTLHCALSDKRTVNENLSPLDLQLMSLYAYKSHQYLQAAAY